LRRLPPGDSPHYAAKNRKPDRVFPEIGFFVERTVTIGVGKRNVSCGRKATGPPRMHLAADGQLGCIWREFFPIRILALDIALPCVSHQQESTMTTSSASARVAS